MTHRPYPNADRALRQLARHGRPEPAGESGAVKVAKAQTALSETGWSALEFGRRWQSALGGTRFPVDEYRLSTR